MLVVESDASVLGVELEHLKDSTDETDHFCRLTVQMHLLFVYLAHIENLVHQAQDALGVVFDGLECLATRSGVL